jgi:hypothetical protein
VFWFNLLLCAFAPSREETFHSYQMGPR